MAEAPLASLATMVCAPWLSPEGVNVHAPDPFAVAVPSVVAPSFNVTTAFGSAVPLNASLDVILSLAEAPVSLTSCSVTTEIVPPVVVMKIPFEPSLAAWNELPPSVAVWHYRSATWPALLVICRIPVAALKLNDTPDRLKPFRSILSSVPKFSSSGPA